MKIAVLANFIISPEIEAKLGIGVTGDKRRSTGTVNLSRGLARQPGIEVHHICPVPFIKKDIVIESDGVNVHFLSIPRRITTLSFLQYTKIRIHRKLNEIKPDIVHGHHAEHGFAYYAITSQYPSLAGIHNYIPALLKTYDVGLISKWRLFKIFEDYTFRYAKDLTVDSLNMERIVKTRSMGEVYRIPNTVHDVFFQNKSQIESDVPSLVFVGVMRPEKGLDILIKSMKILTQRYPEAVLKIIGNTVGPQGDQLNNLIKNLALERNVVFTGWIEWEQMVEEMSNAWVVVVPSTYEQFGCTVVEAMALGKTVIGSRIGGIAENIIDEEDGLLFESGNVQELADKINILLNGKELRFHLSEKAAKKAHNLWHPDTVAQQHVKIYNGILNR